MEEVHDRLSPGGDQHGEEEREDDREDLVEDQSDHGQSGQDDEDPPDDTGGALEALGDAVALAHVRLLRPVTGVLVDTDEAVGRRERYRQHAGLVIGNPNHVDLIEGVVDGLAEVSTNAV